MFDIFFFLYNEFWNYRIVFNAITILLYNLWIHKQNLIYFNY